MVSPPLTRPLETPDIGGYRTEGMHARKQLVSDTEGQHLSALDFHHLPKRWVINSSKPLPESGQV